MLLYLANILDQLDLALEHLKKVDPNNARFALMLTDNVVELVLHQIAKDKSMELRHFSYMREGFEHTAVLEKALGRGFDDKVRFAKLMGIVSGEMAETIQLFHLFRNDVYHIGLQDEAVLQVLAAFYLKTACDFLSSYDAPFISWGSYQKLPERAKKYLRGHDSFPGSKEQYRDGCAFVGVEAGHDPRTLAEELADHMFEVVEDQDTSIDLVSTGAPVKATRDQVVIDCQTWSLAFNDEGRSFAREHEWIGGNHFALVDWLAANYPLKYPKDPIPAWRKRVNRLRHEKNSHIAIKMYRTFMDETADIRERIDEAAKQVDAYIDGEIDRMRFERAMSRSGQT
jgi:hypothetical protein